MGADFAVGLAPGGTIVFFAPKKGKVLTVVSSSSWSKAHAEKWRQEWLEEIERHQSQVKSAAGIADDDNHQITAMTAAAAAEAVAATTFSTQQSPVSEGERAALPAAIFNLLDRSGGGGTSYSWSSAAIKKAALLERKWTQVLFAASRLSHQNLNPNLIEADLALM